MEWLIWLSLNIYNKNKLIKITLNRLIYRLLRSLLQLQIVIVGIIGLKGSLGWRIANTDTYIYIETTIFVLSDPFI